MTGRDLAGAPVGNPGIASSIRVWTGPTGPGRVPEKKQRVPGDATAVASLFSPVGGFPESPVTMRLIPGEFSPGLATAGDPALTLGVKHWLDDVDTETQWRVYQLARQADDRKVREAERDLLNRAFYRFLLGDRRD